MTDKSQQENQPISNGVNFSEHFKDKKITVIGLGLLGRGVGDIQYMAECGADLIVTDLKTEEELEESLGKLKKFPNISYTLGEHKMSDFEGRDMILVGAGVPMDSEYVAHAVECGARKVQSAALFAELSHVPIIGVTGTRGKTTVAQMIHHTLSLATGEQILLGGNIRGVSNLQLLNEIHDGALCVMELDSWQLQGFGWAGISPQTAVFTNFMEDHMHYYNGDMDAYFNDKANIFKNQESTGVLVTTKEVVELAEAKGYTLKQEVVLAGMSVLPENMQLAMPGEHNRLNAALAYEALKVVSLSKEMILQGLETFGGVEGRLQYTKEIKGVKIYNDNNATTPAATVAGLEAVSGGKNVILIAGGHDKKLPLKQLLKAINKHCKKVVLIPGTGTDLLMEELNTNVNISISNTGNLGQAVEEARLASESGDIILFSPAFASFGTYKNEYDRNDQFVDIISKL